MQINNQGLALSSGGESSNISLQNGSETSSPALFWGGGHSNTFSNPIDTIDDELLIQLAS
ncbi:hypothetical protein DVH24_028451 [Malus domestica]|uniref:Uncharacterized protein n=1 Tax=Malus domestica TaxID=3750 RepID=A0A498HDF1_MALDO|nr:hypothetical protein DVH24_028451 [Malus domestica]